VRGFSRAKGDKKKVGRIEEALRRAAAEEIAADTLAMRRDPEAVQTPFVSPWQFEPRPSQSSLGGQRAKSPRVVSQVTSPRLDVNPPNSAPTVRLESQLAMSWPQPFAPEVMEKLVVLPGMDAAAIEQYQRLAASLQQVQRERAVKSVMVTSAIAGEGKTLTAVNLALTLSEFQRKRVLLVDADLRQPRIHELFQVSARTGLKDVLRSRGERKLPIIELTRNLVLLPAGRPDPAATLDAPRMREVLADASASFDWVIVDGAPVTLLPDANLLAAQFDAAILVIEAGKAPDRLIEQAVQGIGRDRLIGVVLNRVVPSVVPARSSVANANRYEQKVYSSRLPAAVAVDAGNPGQVS